MGQYYILDRGSSCFNITAKDGKAVLAAALLEKVRLAEGQAADEWEWNPVYNEHGSIIGFDHSGHKLGSEEPVFKAIAHLVTPGSTIRFVHEDDQCWDVTFDGVGYEDGGSFDGLASEAFADANGLSIHADSDEEIDEAWDEFDPFDFYGGDWVDTGL
jgi:plastocyanin